MTDDTVQLAVLYADICDSVRFYERVGDAVGHRVAERVMERLRGITEVQGGAIVRLQGDGVMSVFPGADAAYDAAVAMQEAQCKEEIAIKVAFSYGAVIESKGEVYGDTVHLAARLLALARSGEILMPEGTLRALSAERRQATRHLDEARVKGRAQPVNVYKVVAVPADREPGFTTLIPVSATAGPAPLGRLVLSYDGREWHHDGRKATLVIGRAADCDLVVRSQVTSRRHALIVATRSSFRLTDQSTNGTYLLNDGGELLFLKRESVQLLGGGMISLGAQPSQAEGHTVVFRYETDH